MQQWKRKDKIALRCTLDTVEWIELQWSENLSTYELMCELPFHCLARSCHLEVLMVISIDSLLIKQQRKLLNVILVISLFTWQDVWRDNSILENMSYWHLYRYVFWPISQHPSLRNNTKMTTLPTLCNYGKTRYSCLDVTSRVTRPRLLTILIFPLFVSGGS